MPFIRRFAAVRPYLFHVTLPGNQTGISQDRFLRPAAQRLGVEAYANGPRRTAQIVGDGVTLMDQEPLHDGNIAWEGGWNMTRLLEELAARVFFWPGHPDGSIHSFGRRHFARYEGVRAVVMRVPFLDVLRENPGVEPHFCKYNSGSPRWSRGQASPRGPATFVRAAECNFPPSEVKEVTFLGPVGLPATLQWRGNPAGPW